MSETRKRKRNRIFLTVQTVLLIAAALMLCAGAVRICLEGLALRETGDALADIYTKEKAAAYLAPVLPVLLLCAVMTAAGAILHIRGEYIAKAGRGTAASHRMKERSVPASAAGRVKILRLVVTAAALCMIGAGIMNGSMRDVLVKAVNLCTECVGLG